MKEAPIPMTNNSLPMKSFLTASLLNAVNVFLAVLLVLVLSPYILRATGDRLYGIFVLVSSFAGWFSLLDFGIATAVSRFITVYYTKGAKEEANVVANSAFFLFVILGIVCFLLTLLILAGTWLLQPTMTDLPTFSAVLFFFGLAFMVNFPTNVCEGIICGVLRHDLNAARAIFFRLLGALGVFLAILFGGKVIAISVVNLVANGINFLVIFWLARRVMPEFILDFRSYRREVTASLFHYAGPVFLTQVAETLLNRSGMIILSVMIALDAVTPYSLVIVSLAGYSVVLFNTVTQWQTNWFVHLKTLGDLPAFAESRRLVFKTTILFALFIAFGYIAWGEAFIIRWIGTIYLSAYPGLIVMMLFFASCYGTSVSCWRILLAIDRHRYYSILSLVHAVLAVLLGILFVHWGGGITGVVIGGVLPGVVIHFVLIPLYTCQQVGDSLFRFYGQNFITFIAGGIALIPAALLTHYFVQPSYPLLFLLGTVGFCTYFPLIFWLAFSHQERRKLLAHFKRLPLQQKTEEKWTS